MKILANKQAELAKARDVRCQEVNRVRDTVLEEGFYHDGDFLKLTTAHQVGLQNLLVSANSSLPSTFNGRLKMTHGVAEMGEAEMVEVVTRALHWATQVQQVAIGHKHQIREECANTSEVKAYDITVDWP